MSANVRSLEAIEAVRAALASFSEEVAQSLSMIDIEMRRVLDWLEHDRPRFWKHQVRRSMDGVTEARAALHRALMYPIADERPSCYEERAALKEAEARLAYCQEKEERLRQWVREVRHEMFEYEGRISQLSDVVELDVPHAIGIINRLLARLQEYQEIRTSMGATELAEALWSTSPLPLEEGRGEGASKENQSSSSNPPPTNANADPTNAEGVSHHSPGSPVPRRTLG